MALISLFYTKIYVVVYGLLLLVISQSTPLPINVYTLILSQDPVAHLTSSILGLALNIRRYATGIMLMVPLLSIEIIRVIFCCRPHILHIEALILLLVTGDIAFTLIYAILASLLIKPLSLFLSMDDRCSRNRGEVVGVNSREQHGVERAESDVGRSRSIEYGMMFISIGTSILIFTALIAILRTHIFTISIIVYTAAIIITYVRGSNFYSSTTPTLIISRAVAIGVPLYGVISHIRCQ